MLRIFVTGDNHIGLKYANHKESADILKSKRTEAFKSMVEAANSEECSLFVITGDLFDSTSGIAKRDMDAVLKELADFHGTVAVLPGNHDYYDKESKKLWTDFENLLSGYDNIMLLKEYKAYEVPVGDEVAILYPAFCTSNHSAPGQNNLGWIKDTKISDDRKYHIGIAHGAVEGETIDKKAQYFIMKREELEAIPVDVWLLGHTHVPFPKGLDDDYTTGKDKIFNPGTHVQTDVNCNTEGLCFIIEIDDDKTIRAKKFVSGNVRFYRKTIKVTAGSMEETIKRELADIGDDSSVEIVLEGAVYEEEYNDRFRIAGEALSRFIEGNLTEDSKLCKLITKEIIDSEFSETSFAAALLGSLLDNPKEAQLAYDLIKEIKEGKVK